MAINMIARTTILIRDLAEAKQFYIEALGFSLIWEGHGMAHVGPAAQAQVGIWLLPAHGEAQQALVGKQVGVEPAMVMYTDDCVSTYEALKAKGVRFKFEPRVTAHDAVTHFYDLYGNEIVLVQLPERNPVRNQIGGVFVPVRDIAKARDWYNRILGLSGGEILHGHLYCPQMNGGTGLILDSKNFKGPVADKPLFHFNTRDVVGARRFMAEQGVELVGEIEHGHWFLFRDPDGNLLMVCKC